MSVNLYGIPSVKATGELSLIDPWSSCSDQLEIGYVFHCDGLLLCTSDYTDNDYEDTVIVVWNPCTVQTRWIQPSTPDSRYAVSYALGSAGNNSYKVLSYGNKHDLQILELNSDSWKNLHVTLDYNLTRSDLGVSLKGKTYWFASDGIGRGLGLFLVRFDYTREKFERLPSQCPIGMGYDTVALSVVGDEKLSMLLQRN